MCSKCMAEWLEIEKGKKTVAFNSCGAERDYTYFERNMKAGIQN